jgi:transcriptional regulator with XRE-family HTH domain
MHVSPLRRERKKRGWSLERAASELCKVAAEHGLGSLAVDGTTLGRYERGTIHFPREPVPEAMSILYGRPIYVLWPEQAWQEVTEDATITDIDRRALLRLLGSTVGVATLADDSATPVSGPSPVPDLSGIWHSRYVYFSDGRGQEFEGHHYVVLTQQDNRLVGQSLPHTSESELKFELVVEGSAVSGVWSEKTSPSGYYQGATYTGAIHLLLAPTGKAMTGKWLGFGRDLKINSGDWHLRWVDEAAQQEQYHLAV